VTLVVTVGSANWVLQVSDRRFTYPPGRSAPAGADEKNKEVVIHAADADLAVAFTGLAEIGPLSTGDWLLEAISRAKGAESGFDACIDAVRVAADAAYAGSTVPWNPPRPLTFIFAGFQKNGRQPQIATVSNCQSIHFRTVEVSRRFGTYSVSNQPHPYHVAGATPAVAQDSRPKIRGVARRTRDCSAVADLVVAEVRRAAKHAKHGKFIGESCMSICISRDGGIHSR